MSLKISFFFLRTKRFSTTEIAKDYAKLNRWNIIGGYFSPVSDAYNKKDLASAVHRVKMCELSVESSDWIMVDTWESLQASYQPTVVVLNHFYYCLNKELCKGDRPIQVRLLCGSDLLESMNRPGIWAPEDIDEIVRNYGIVAIERSESDIRSLIYNNDILFSLQENIHIIPQYIRNDISSTELRRSIARGLSIKYLTPDSVITYIKENKLFR